MHRLWIPAILVSTALACSPAPSEPSVAPADGNKGTVVDFDGMKSIAPGEWTPEEVKGGLRYLQFRLKRAKDDPADAEVVIFKGIGGSAEANIDRWKDMFRPPEGKTINDVAKVTLMQVGKAKVSYLDVSGTYLSKAPTDPMGKVDKRPNSRMLGVVFDGPENVYHIRLVGHADTVAQYKKGFDEWLKNFK